MWKLGLFPLVGGNCKPKTYPLASAFVVRITNIEASGPNKKMFIWILGQFKLTKKYMIWKFKIKTHLFAKLPQGQIRSGYISNIEVCSYLPDEGTAKKLARTDNKWKVMVVKMSGKESSCGDETIYNFFDSILVRIYRYQPSRKKFIESLLSLKL